MPDLCQCETPLIRCDNRGCRCTVCGKAEDGLRSLKERAQTKERRDVLTELRERMRSRAELYAGLAVSDPELVRGQVWCRTCGATRCVNSAAAMRDGWPKCCGFTMPDPKALADKIAGRLESFRTRPRTDEDGEPGVHLTDREWRIVEAALRADPSDWVAEMRDTVSIPLETALIIDGSFLPTNPNKMRSAHPDVVAAAHAFKAALRALGERDG